MLEVKNLVRIYKTKKGESVKALNEVSVKFPDTGLIFILGKSGSGKSTLLNVMGGLDKSDSGEIIIKGKSSKDFKQSDFDSYRNTYLGFIFQEYNILDEFNVGQNIALALELQGKKVTSEIINNILEEVDLKGYASRKTNELSGGQKQRVAIARALVKNPEIIFADEPTGALDSKTGIQVFDTLKKLSQNKLVVVVSHDRDFAETYGDRVIELADGVIISDIEKTKIKGESKSSGVTIVDEKVIKIDKDYEITDEDLKIIRQYLNSFKGERLISLDSKINTSVRSIARIDDDGNKESFIKTDESKILNKSGSFSSIHSKLSLKNCFKIGGSSLKVKPFRLIITILLSIVAFCLFGLADTVGSYEKIEATVRSINDANYNSISVEKSKIYGDGDYKYSQVVNSNEKDIDILKEKYGIDFEGVYTLDNRYSSNGFSINNFYKNTSSYISYYVTQIPGLYVSSEEDVENKGLDLVCGTYPDDTNEICITSHLYESFKQFGYEDRNNNITIEASAITPEKLLNNVLSFYTSSGEVLYTITGIIDTHFDTSRYSKLKQVDNSSSLSMGLYMLSEQYKDECTFGYNTLLFTNQKTADDLSSNDKIEINGQLTVSYENNDYYYSNLIKLSSTDNVIFSDSSKTSLNTKETLIHIGELVRMINADPVKFSECKLANSLTIGGNTINNLSELSQYLDYSQYVSTFAKENYDDAIENGMNIYEIDQKLWNSLTEYSTKDDMINVYSNYINNLIGQGVIENYYSNNSFSQYYMEQIKPLVEPNISTILESIGNPNVKLIIYGDNTNVVYDEEPFSIVGISFDLSSKTYNALYIEDSIYNDLTSSFGSYTYLIANMPNNETLRNIIIDTYDEDGEVNTFMYSLENGIMPSFDSINSTIESMASIFLYVGIGFAVFASLMLFNFISISISYKKREIGILRAVGARSKDVFLIFFAESFIISMISYLFATIGTFIFSQVINTSLQNEANLAITVLIPGIRQIVLILGVCLVVAFISTFIPVYNIAKKRPIDAIKDR